MYACCIGHQCVQSLSRLVSLIHKRSHSKLVEAFYERHETLDCCCGDFHNDTPQGSYRILLVG